MHYLVKMMDWKDWCRLCGDVVQEETVIKPSHETFNIFKASEIFFSIVVRIKKDIFII